MLALPILAGPAWNMAEAGEADFQGSLGLGILDTDRFPGSSERRQRSIPVLDIQYRDRYYFRFTQLGAWLWQSDDFDRRQGWRAGPAARPRFRVSPPPETPTGGEQERPFALDLGLRWEGNGRYGTLSLAAYADGFQRHQGYSARIGLSSFIPLGDTIRLLPAITLDWESAQIGQFYYGIQGLDQPGSALIPGASLIAQINLSESWLATLGAFASRQASDRQDHGLVQRRTSTTAVAGISFRF